MPFDLHLPVGQVQVWHAWLDSPAEKLTYFESLLSNDEHERSKRFFFERDRHNYITARGLLRCLLGAYLEMEPEKILISYGRQRKPAIRSERPGTSLEFNLSHSNGLGAFAFCLGSPVGIDIEYIRPLPDEDRFAEQFFSATEIDWMAAHSGFEKQEGFFKIWTCKEAFFKANGEGLTVPISQAVIDLEGSQSPRLAAIDGSREQARRWKMVSYQPAAGYQAALAVEELEWDVSMEWLTV